MITTRRCVRASCENSLDDDVGQALGVAGTVRQRGHEHAERVGGGAGGLAHGIHSQRVDQVPQQIGDGRERRRAPSPSPRTRHGAR